MSAPVLDADTAPADVPEGAAPIVLPVMVIEGLETSDRRYIEPGSVEVRDLPIPLYAATRSTHGDTGDAATWHVGAITSAERVPGPEAKLYGGQSLPEGTFAWVGRGWMYKDVPAEPAKSAYQLVKDKALRGNSVDMTEVVAEFQGPNGELADQTDYERISMQRSVIAATTLVGIPAFAGAYISLDGEDIEPNPEAEALAASGTPHWLSAELGDTCHSCQVDEHFAVDGFHEFVTAAKRNRAEDAGHAMPGGRYPIENKADLDKAIRAVGRAGGPSGTEEDRNAVRKHIIAQAKRLKLADKIPDTWNSDGTLKTGGKQAAGLVDVEALADEAMARKMLDKAAAEQDYSTSGMVALVPANPQMLVVPGGDPADQLHLTLAYLGEEVDTWEPDMVAAVHQAARELTDFDAALLAERDRMVQAGMDPTSAEGLPSISKSEAQKGPLDGAIFAHAVFNPNGDNGHDPATVYLLDGQGDRTAIEWLRNDVVARVRNAIGDVNFPTQHEPFVPHVTAGYGVEPSQVTYTGPVTFDRIRVAIGEDVTDYPLGGGDAVLVASAADLPHVSVFEDPQLDGPTPWTVQGDRVYGHLALWGTCHTGFSDRCRTAPRSASNYSYFRVHAARARTDAGDVVTVPVGYATVSRAPGVGGHAAARAGMTAAEVAAHYDNTCTAAAEVAAGEDEYGIWVSGRVLPGLDEDTRYKLQGAALSGDWRRIRGSMELVAALAVNTPGFPVPWRSLVAAGEPQALVAAGMPMPNLDVREARVTDKLSALYGLVQSTAAEQLAALTADAPTFSELQADAEVDMLLALNADHPWFDDDAQPFSWQTDVPGWEGSVGPFKGEFTQPHVYARDVHSGAGNCVCGSALGETLHVQAAPGVEVPERMRDQSFAKRKNWVEKAGGLPKYIKRIAKHLQEKGMDQSRAIATAVNAAKKMCATGDLNFPGSQQVNPGSKAEACAAVADWEAKKAKS